MLSFENETSTFRSMILIAYISVPTIFFFRIVVITSCFVYHTQYNKGQGVKETH